MNRRDSLHPSYSPFGPLTTFLPPLFCSTRIEGNKDSRCGAGGRGGRRKFVFRRLHVPTAADTRQRLEGDKGRRREEGGRETGNPPGCLASIFSMVRRLSFLFRVRRGYRRLVDPTPPPLPTNSSSRDDALPSVCTTVVAGDGKPWVEDVRQ